MLEQLTSQVKYPCTYGKYGCKGSFSFDMILEHEDTCRFSPLICPVAKMKIETCSWNGSTSDIQKHLKAARLLFNGFQPIFLSDVSASRTFFRFLFDNSEVFCCHFQVKDGVFCAIMNSIGPAQSESKYRYKMKFFFEEKKEAASFRLVFCSGILLTLMSTYWTQGTA
jgi:hypothetical protein